MKKTRSLRKMYLKVIFRLSFSSSVNFNFSQIIRIILIYLKTFAKNYVIESAMTFNFSLYIILPLNICKVICHLIIHNLLFSILNFSKIQAGYFQLNDSYDTRN